MASNHFGDILKFSLFGESHGSCVGGLLDGIPAGTDVNLKEAADMLSMRKTASGIHTSPRTEEDIPEFLSGVRNGKTTGGPVCFIIRNTGQNPEDYHANEKLFRPSHADFTYFVKYGTEVAAGRDRSSGRITAPAVVAGVLARSILKNTGIRILSWTSSMGLVSTDRVPATRDEILANPYHFPDPEKSADAEAYLSDLKKAGDSCGGTISCLIQNCPAGLGDPVFDKLQMKLAAAMFFIPSVKAFEYGSGFDGTKLIGSKHNDPYLCDEKGMIGTSSNHSGGIQGGISNGQNIFFRIGVKAASSVSVEQHTVSREGKPALIKVSGRHDVCHVPRVVPVAEAMALLALADSYLKNRT